MAFDIRVITPEEVFFEGRSRSLIAPGYEGYLGVLTNHAPLLTPLTEGILTIRLEQGGDKQFKIGGGFLEVNKNHVLVLVERVAETTVAATAAH